MRGPYLTMYRDLFQAVRNKVHAKTTFSSITPGARTSTISASTMSQELIFNPSDDIKFSIVDGVEAYVNQVNEFLDGGGFNVDKALDAWYDALMGEIQNGDAQMMG
jgi:hypothetical protein